MLLHPIGHHKLLERQRAAGADGASKLLGLCIADVVGAEAERRQRAAGHTGRQGLRALVADVVDVEIELRQRAAGADRLSDRYCTSGSKVVLGEDERRPRIAGADRICDRFGTLVADVVAAERGLEFSLGISSALIGLLFI